jgi:hypothetical protein
MNAYDRALFRRALFALAVLMLLTGTTVVATDEAASTLSMRLARISALAPLLIAVAILAVGGHARVRGELRAIEALGVAPWTSLRGAELAGVAAAVATVLVLVAPFTDVTSLLPAVAPPIDWTVAADGSHATAPGLVVLASGVIQATTATSPPSLRHVATWAVVPCVAPIAAVAPGWAATPMSVAARAWSGVVTVLLVVVGLHLVAAARVPPGLTVLAALPMAVSLWRARQ